jgi:molecular chaperone GrpE
MSEEGHEFDVEADEMPDAAAAAPVEADIERLQTERDQYLETARQLQADFENYRKRMLREQTAQIERANESLLEQLLLVLDSFELALGNLEGKSDEVAQVRKGVELVFAELLAVLERAGVERIDALGEPFDPNLHEAVAQVGAEGDEAHPQPVVADIMRAGYRLKGRVLRPAMVKVAK